MYLVARRTCILVGCLQKPGCKVVLLRGMFFQSLRLWEGQKTCSRNTVKPVYLDIILEKNAFALSFCLTFYLIKHQITLSGTYKPRVRCFDTYQLSQKFERCLDSEG